LYPDAGHPDGVRPEPWFRIRGGFVYAAEGNPVRSAAPWYSMRGNLLYPDRGHPEGPSEDPWFRIA
jgi:hypothetical protein